MNALFPSPFLSALFAENTPEAPPLPQTVITSLLPNSSFIGDAIQVIGENLDLITGVTFSPDAADPTFSVLDPQNALITVPEGAQSGLVTFTGQNNIVTKTFTLLVIQHPVAPTSCFARLSGDKIKLRWTRNSNHLHQIQRSSDSSDWETIFSLPTQSSMKDTTDTGLQRGTEYYYRIRAINTPHPNGQQDWPTEWVPFNDIVYGWQGDVSDKSRNLPGWILGTTERNTDKKPEADLPLVADEWRSG